MKKTHFILSALLAFACAAPVLATERVDHFKGAPAATLEAAVRQFSQYNKELANLLSKPELSPQDILSVHQITYSLENALEKLRAELGELADTLEELHVASEKYDSKAVKHHGDAYLGTAQKVIP